MKRRLPYLAGAVACMAAGLWLRLGAVSPPRWVAAWFPDALWAMLVYCAFGLLLAKGPKAHAPCALIFSVCIELSQLYHPPWLDALRMTRLGGLVLGWGFLWSDLACYAAGIAACFLLEWRLRRRAR